MSLFLHISLHSGLYDLPNNTECMRMCRRVRVEKVDADDLVIGARSEISVVAREPDSMDRSRVCTDGSELLGFRIIWIVGLEDSFGGPYSYMGIYCAWLAYSF